MGPTNDEVNQCLDSLEKHPTRQLAARLIAEYNKPVYDFADARPELRLMAYRSALGFHRRRWWWRLVGKGVNKRPVDYSNYEDYQW